MNSWKPIATLILCASSLPSLGCGSSYELPLADVEGRVLIDGRPLEQGQVLFVPEKGRGAHASIAPDGTFTLSTYGDGDGAIVGPHRVSVSSRSTTGDDPNNIDAPKISHIPERYSNPATSGLTFQVESDKTNEPIFELSSHPGP